jgi:long-subunit acyl-CoA synthetase (AMP-forming)
VILYTSGTTGAPKGRGARDLNLVHSVRHYRHGLGLRARRDAACSPCPDRTSPGWWR